MRLAHALLLLVFACKAPQVQTSARDESREGSGAGRPNGPLTAGGALQGAATGVNATAPTNAAWPAVPSGWVAKESSLLAGYVNQNGTAGIPEYIRLYRSHSAQTKDSMYLAIARLSQANITVGYTGKAAVTSQLARNCVFGVNGGYFSGKQSVSIVKIGDELRSADAQNLVRPSGTAQPTRATFFWDEASRRAFFHWASVMQGKIQIFATAADPYSAARKGGSSPAGHSLALGGGPMLIWQDAVTVTTAKEAFDSGIHADLPHGNRSHTGGLPCGFGCGWPQRPGSRVDSR
jgi:hypothetical protein